jgi:hypothetical protein
MRMTQTSDYGKKAAMKRAALKKKREEEKNKKFGPPKPIVEDVSELKKKKKKEPHLDWYPIENDKKPDEQLFELDWNDVDTVTNSDKLFSMLSYEDENKRAALFDMPPGFGKTSVAVRTMGLMQKQAQKEVPFIVTTTANSIAGRGFIRTIKTWNRDNPDNQLNPLLVTTFDKLSNALDHNKSLTKIVRNLDPKHSLLILDEAHKYKSPSSKRSKKLRKLSAFKKLGLSATYIANDAVMDMGSYLIMADFYTSKTDFMHKTKLHQFQSKFGLLVYDSNGRVKRDVWPQYDNVLAQYGSILYKPDVSNIDEEMPNVKNHIIQFPFNEELNADMKSLKRTLNKRVFDNYVDYFMSFIERLHSDEQRLNKVIEIVKNPETKQPLIFFENVIVKEALIKALEDAGITDYYLIAGGSSDSFENFDHSRNIPILAQYVSAGESIEFKQSNTTIFYQNQRSYINLEQAKGRNSRRGMSHQIYHYYMIADDPTDKMLYQTVKNKQSISEETLIASTIEALKKRY